MVIFFYCLISWILSFTVGYIVGVYKTQDTENPLSSNIKLYREQTKDFVDCVGYRGGRKCDRKASKYSFTGLCNSCDDARFGY